MFNFNNTNNDPNYCIKCNSEMVKADNEEKINLYKYGLLRKKINRSELLRMS